MYIKCKLVHYTNLMRNYKRLLLNLKLSFQSQKSSSENNSGPSASIPGGETWGKSSVVRPERHYGPYTTSSCQAGPGRESGNKV